MRRRSAREHALAVRFWTALRVLLGLVIASSGCASGLPLTELPDAPIAVRYFDAEQARRAAEDLAEIELASRRKKGRQAGRSRRGVASVADIDRFLSSSLNVRKGARETGYRQDASERSPRLAFLDPRKQELTIVPQARAGSAPVDWSLDRRFLLFSQLQNGYEQLFEYDRESREVRPITKEPGAHPWGCYGPGGRIVAERVDYWTEGPSSRLVISNPGGSGFRDLTSGPVDQRPSCSPDGSKIVYITGGRGLDGTVIVRSFSVPAASAANGREPAVEVAIGPLRKIGPGVDPSFSPDGELIMYSAATRVQAEHGVQHRWRLRRVRASGHGRGSFEMGPVDQFEPAISPDGRIVAYIGIDPEFNQVLYVRRVDGTGERILYSDGAALGPVW